MYLNKNVYFSKGSYVRHYKLLFTVALILKEVIKEICKPSR